MMTTIKSNGLLAREKGQSLANNAIDAFSNCPESRRAWFEEALFDLVELPRLDAAIPGFVEELAPVVAAGHSVEGNIGAAENDKALIELHAHPEGARVAYCTRSNRLLVWVTGDDPGYVEVPIGYQGLRQLARDMLHVADELEAAQ